MIGHQKIKNLVIKGLVIRQSAVLEDRDPSLGKWREIFMINALRNRGYEVGLICSSFDHYLGAQRKVSPDNYYPRTFIKTPGYGSPTSPMRVLDAWIFSIKLFFLLARQRHSLNFVIVSFPTPESVFVVSLLSRYFRVYIDIRDAWPDAFPLQGWTKKAFGFYCRFLFRSAAARSTSLLSMSDSMNRFVARQLGDVNCPVIPNPIMEPSFNDISMNEFPVYEKLSNRKANSLLIFFVGTLNAQFDFSYVQLASRSLAKKNIDCTFLIAGGGENFESIASDLSTEKIVFLGQLDKNICDKFSQIADGFFCFYRNKSFHGHLSNKIIDYLRFRKPIFHNLGQNLCIGLKSKPVGINVKSTEEFTSKLVEYYYQRQCFDEYLRHEFSMDDFSEQLAGLIDEG